MKSNKYESIDDIKPPIPPDLLSYAQVVAGIVGFIIILCMLYIPARPWSKGIVMVVFAILAVVIVAKILATVNDSKEAKDTIDHVDTTYPDSRTTQESVVADYKTLEARGRELMAREKQQQDKAQRE